MVIAPGPKFAAATINAAPASRLLAQLKDQLLAVQFLMVVAAPSTAAPVLVHAIRSKDVVPPVWLARAKLLFANPAVA